MRNSAGPVPLSRLSDDVIIQENDATHLAIHHRWRWWIPSSLLPPPSSLRSVVDREEMDENSVSETKIT